jgi:hypothetical protein
MAMASVVILDSAAGARGEAIAMARDGNGLLPPGMWRIKKDWNDCGKIMAIEDMPEHWRSQLNRIGEFAKKIEFPDLDKM